MKQWYTHGLTDALEPNEVYTPAPDKARAPIIFIFGKLPVDSGIQPRTYSPFVGVGWMLTRRSIVDAPETDLSMTLQNGKVNRLVSVPLDERGRTWTREFAAWLAKDSQTRAA